MSYSGPQGSSSRIGTGQAQPRASRSNEPSREEMQELRKKWASEVKNLPPRPPTGRKAGKTTYVLTNHFKVTFQDSQRSTLCRYNIVLGDLEYPKPDGTSTTRKATSREAKRSLINSFLESLDKLATGHTYACDFFSTIVSARPLWPHSKFGHSSRPVSHSYTQAGGTEAQMSSRLDYLGPVRIDLLTQLVSQPAAANGYLPDEELKALNIVSWRSIFKDTFAGGRVGKKFFPDTPFSDARYDSKKDQKLVVLRNHGGNRGDVVYYAIAGYFTSMRPGIGSVFLNVNATTSAFFPWPIPRSSNNPNTLSEGISLQTWLERRFPGRGVAAFHRSAQELRNVRVYFEGDPLKKPRPIWRLSQNDVQNTIFNRPAGTPLGPGSTATLPAANNISVLSHMEQSESFGPKSLKHFILTVPVEYGRHTPADLRFKANAACIDVGNARMTMWYPADHLYFMPWQIVTTKLDPMFTSDMIKPASRHPQENMQRILDHALGPLGITSTTPQNVEYEVSESSCEIGIR